MISPEDDMTSTSAIATIGTAIGGIFGSVHVHGTTSTFSRAAYDFHIVYKVAFHLLETGYVLIVKTVKPVRQLY